MAEKGTTKAKTGGFREKDEKGNRAAPKLSRIVRIR